MELFQDKQGKWRYRVTGRNGEKMVTSEAYYSKDNARRGYEDLCKVMDLRGVVEDPTDEPL